MRTNRVKRAVCCDIHPRSERTFACRIANVMALKCTSVVFLVRGHPLIKLSKRGDKLPCRQQTPSSRCSMSPGDSSGISWL